MKAKPTVAELIKELGRFSPDLLVVQATGSCSVTPLLGSVGVIHVLEVREGLEYRIPVDAADQPKRERQEMLFIG